MLDVTSNSGVPYIKAFRNAMAKACWFDKAEEANLPGSQCQQMDFLSGEGSGASPKKIEKKMMFVNRDN